MTEQKTDDLKKPESSAEGPEIDSQKARGGEIILNTPLRRAVFIGGLVAMVLIVILASIIGYS